MSINRLLIRTAAIAAISNFNREPWPTLAGPMVFDSKIEPVENIDEKLAYPICVVYTDYDRNSVIHGDLAVDGRSLTITFELLMAMMSDSTEGGAFTVRYPVTDSELETALDIFEHQVFTALRADNSAAHAFRTIAYGIDNVVSRRGATVEGGQKLAARQITYEAKVLSEWAHPTVPGYLVPFLNDLEQSTDYGYRVDTIRGLYEEPGAIHEMVRQRRTLGWSDGVLNALGYDIDEASLLPANLQINWLTSGS